LPKTVTVGMRFFFVLIIPIFVLPIDAAIKCYDGNTTKFAENNVIARQEMKEVLCASGACLLSESRIKRHGNDLVVFDHKCVPEDRHCVTTGWTHQVETVTVPGESVVVDKEMACCTSELCNESRESLDESNKGRNSVASPSMLLSFAAIIAARF
ncbi:hypothetical protein PMAYCL1PPCAC_05701, partial [Pristionchus mayeri]